MSARPDLLFLSPVLPDPDGIGLAQRAALFVRALARHHRIFLHVLPVFGPARKADGALLRDLYAGCVVEPLEGYEDPLFRMIRRIRDPRHRLAAMIAYPRPMPCRFATEQAVANLAARYPTIDVLHVFRLYLAPFAAPFLEAARVCRPVCRLDLDDDESETHRRFAALAACTGRVADAPFEGAEAAKYEALEAAYLSRFDAVFLAGGGARERLAGRYGDGSFIEIPNAVRLPPSAPPPPAPGGARTILFLGTMNYAPNEDAARFLCDEVLPLIRARRAEPVRVVIAGRSPTTAVRALGTLAGVEVIGPVSDVRPVYAGSEIVLAPLRAGGGTRIKILEAFAHRRPVVATTVGAEGILARDGEHLLIRDAPEDIAAACVHLLDHPDEAAQVAERAHALVRSTYTERVVMAAIERLTAPHRHGLPGRKPRPEARPPRGRRRSRAGVAPRGPG